MHPYLFLQEEVLKHGFPKMDRTGTGTISKPGLLRRYDIRNDIVAAVTTKQMHFKTGLVEEKWMMSGDTRLKFLKENNCNIWDEWVLDGTGIYRLRTLKEMERVYKRNHFGYDNPGVLDMGWKPSDKWRLVAEHPEFRVWLWLDTSISNPAHHVEDLSEGYENGLSWDTPDDPIWMNFYRALGISDQEVIDGELGKVYGAMFRKVPDTRMVPVDSVDHKVMHDRGFTYMGEMQSIHDEVPNQDIYHRDIDQVSELLKLLGTDPDSRRLILCPWNPAYLDEQALPPCHSFIQFWTRELDAHERYAIHKERCDRMQREVNERAAANPECTLSNMYTQIICLSKDIYLVDRNDPTQGYDLVALDGAMDALDLPKRALTCILYQRSADVGLGVPYNLTFYSILTHKLARQFNMWGEELIHITGDTHIYANHIDQIKEQQTRTPFQPPYLKYKKPVGTSILDYNYDDVEVVGYVSHPALPMPIAV